MNSRRRRIKKSGWWRANEISLFNIVAGMKGC
jgi:hypothetical protein